jgi:two-component system nitrogen regulation response regulator GlnG
MLLDMKMPNMDGAEVLVRVKKLAPELPVVIITAYGEIHDAVEAVKAGAYDYLTKPFRHDDLMQIIHRALSEGELRRKLRDICEQITDDIALRKFMGPSEVVGKLISMVNQVARSDFTVVIQGETGSGKELVARAIHNASLRSSGPFIPVDCGAIPETLLESELFGHAKGAFTGAQQKKTGKLVAAEDGTVFLDEVSNLSMASQAKLLRAIQEKKVVPLGSNEPVSINTRLLAASNQDLYTLSKSGAFRSDLFYRLNEFTIKVPPLRDRKEDILYLAKRFLDITNAELNKTVKGFSESALEMLQAFPWPGNVRELRSTIRRAVLLADDIITVDHLDIRKRTLAPTSEIAPKIEDTHIENISLKEMVRQNQVALERKILTQTLRYTEGNKSKAAKILKIDYKTIYTKIKQLGIKT